MTNNQALDHAHISAKKFLDELHDRPVGPRESMRDIVNRLNQPLPTDGDASSRVVDWIVEALEPGLVASAGPRYFGFVIGGGLPSAIAADWLTSVWDQNVALEAMSPALAAVEIVASRWVREALQLDTVWTVGFTTGATMAQAVGLAAGRHRLLARKGWDVEEYGIQGAPPIRLICSAESHASLFNASRYLGLGTATWCPIDVDRQGRMRAAHLAQALSRSNEPTLVAGQAGNVNSGAFDPLTEIAEACSQNHAWLHVDAAFGGWCRASDDLAYLAEGIQSADSLTLDAHKWLNVPYDSGIALVQDADAHRHSMSVSASYLTAGHGGDGMDWVPEASRRGRGLVIYAALRELGRYGLAQLITRCCRLTRLFAETLSEEPGITILNDVVVNQAVVEFSAPSDRDPTEFRDEVLARIQSDGTCWAGPTYWRNTPAMRISVSNWRTDESDIEISGSAIRSAYRACRYGGN